SRNLPTALIFVCSGGQHTVANVACEFGLSYRTDGGRCGTTSLRSQRTLGLLHDVPTGVLGGINRRWNTNSFDRSSLTHHRPRAIQISVIPCGWHYRPRSRHPRYADAYGTQDGHASDTNCHHTGLSINGRATTHAGFRIQRIAL